MTRFFYDFDDDPASVLLKVRHKKEPPKNVSREDASLQKSRYRKNCRGKQHFKEHAEAQQALERYMSQIIFSSMAIYFCHRHAGFCLGHNKRMLNSTIRFREGKMARQYMGTNMATPESYY